MSRAILGALLLGLVACNEGFVSPDQPDLYKVPHHYDLGDDELDLSVPQSSDKDMDNSGNHKDMSAVPVDLHEPDHDAG
jgi:hypothetical protein